jgi:hypothetical protein
MDSFKHDVPTLGGGQKTFEQCWYASYRTLLKYHKRDPGELESKLNGVNINVDEAKAKGLLDTDYKKAADALGLQRWSGAPFKKVGWVDFGLNDGTEAFLKELKISPLWVSRYVGPGSYHIVIATGYNDDGKGYIIYNNPFPGPYNAIEDTSLLANVFTRHITDAMGSVQAVR